jgi:hypothetical protein
MCMSPNRILQTRIHVQFQVFKIEKKAATVLYHKFKMTLKRVFMLTCAI